MALFVGMSVLHRSMAACDKVRYKGLCLGCGVVSLAWRRGVGIGLCESHSFDASLVGGTGG